MDLFDIKEPVIIAEISSPVDVSSYNSDEDGTDTTQSMDMVFEAVSINASGVKRAQRQSKNNNGSYRVSNGSGSNGGSGSNCGRGSANDSISNNESTKPCVVRIKRLLHTHTENSSTKRKAQQLQKKVTANITEAAKRQPLEENGNKKRKSMQISHGATSPLLPILTSTPSPSPPPPSSSLPMPTSPLTTVVAARKSPLKTPLKTPLKSLLKTNGESVPKAVQTVQTVKTVETVDDQQELILRYGKRFFACIVKVKRLKDAVNLMGTNRKSKSKSKLSVSFSESVEILGSKPRKSLTTKVSRSSLQHSKDSELNGSIILNDSASNSAAIKRSRSSLCNGGDY